MLSVLAMPCLRDNSGVHNTCVCAPSNPPLETRKNHTCYAYQL